MICSQDNFAGEKVFEYFQDNEVLLLRQFCRRKKSLNIFRIMMICVEDTFAGKRVFEYFQDNDGFQLRQFCRRISL